MCAERICYILLGVVWSAFTAALPAWAEGRVALVIGNGAYAESPLRNAPNDARGMAAALRECGFSVTERVDCDYRVMEESIRDFGRDLRAGDVALFYYAGHGMQIEGRNYLIPVGADIRGEDEVPFKAVDAALVLGKMGSAGSSVNVVILDACRENPYARTFRGKQRGLHRMDAPSGTLLAYATAPGRVAAEGEGEHSPYTQAVLDHIRTSGLPVELLFKAVRSDVMSVTADEQAPWESTSLRGDFYFVKQAAATHQAAAPSPPEHLSERPAAEPARETVPATGAALQTSQRALGQVSVVVDDGPASVFVNGAHRGYADAEEPLVVRDVPYGIVRITAALPSGRMVAREDSLSAGILVVPLAFSSPSLQVRARRGAGARDIAAAVTCGALVVLGLVLFGP